MTWYAAYLACFVLGLTFVAISAAVGQFGGDAHGGGHDAGGHDAGGHHHDVGGHDGGIPLPLFSPSVLAIFIGMFGAGGLFLLKVLGLTSPLLHVPGASAISLTSGFGVAWAMMKLMRYAESNTLASHSEVVGRAVEVTQSIRGAEWGEIAYEAGGARQTLVARGDGQTTFKQGDQAQVLAVEDGIARVGAVGSLLEIKTTSAAPETVGVPVGLNDSKKQ